MWMDVFNADVGVNQKLNDTNTINRIDVTTLTHSLLAYEVDQLQSALFILDGWQALRVEHMGRI